MPIKKCNRYILSSCKIHKIILVLFFLFPPYNCWSTTVSLSLDDLIGIALKNNPQIEIAAQQYTGSEGKLTQARSLYLPHFSAGASLGRTHVKGLEPVDEDNVGLGLLKARQLIYDFGKTTGLINASAFDREASLENLKQIYHNVVFSIKDSFYSVLESKRLITVAEQAVVNYEQQLYRAEKYFEAGVRTKIDITNAKVNLSNQKLALLRATSALKVARVNLEQVLGEKPNNGDYALISERSPLDKLAAEKPEMPGPLENLLDAARTNRPGLKQFTFLVKAAESSLAQARGEYWPSIDAVADYNSYESDLSNLADQWQIGVGLTWEIFSGFETEGKVVEAKALLQEVRASLREFDLSVTQDVTESYLRADENGEGVNIAEQALELAAENLELAKGRYTSGLGDILEFNDAQLLYTQNQSELVITYYNYLRALALLERAVGVIPELQDYDIAPN